MRVTSRNRSNRRRGVVLLVVMAMLALFATVGLSFVFYAESEATSSRFRRQAETQETSDIPPDRLFSYVLGQILYDTDNPDSKLKGMSLARSIYGIPGSTVPYSGKGRQLPAADGTNITNLTAVDGQNAPYTYPDLNNPYLGAINSQGEIIHRSYERKSKDSSSTDKWYTMSVNGGSTGTTNKEEGDVRNLENAFKVKGDGTDRYNDSFWIDAGFPVMRTKDGVFYKPLVAPFMLDLDNRINLAVAGNYLVDYTVANLSPNASTPPSVFTSRYGIGPWEINPLHLWPMSSMTAPQQAMLRSEVKGLLRDNVTVPSRIGRNTNGGKAFVLRPDSQVPANWFYDTTSSAFHTRAPFYGLEKPISPSYTANTSYRAFPDLPATTSWPAVTAGTDHACMFDYFKANRTQVQPPPTDLSDVRLGVSNTEAMVRYGEKGSAFLTSDLFRFFPNSLDPTNPNFRKVLHMITSYSMAMDVPHLGPLGQITYSMTDTDEYPSASVNATSTSGETNAYNQSKIAELLLNLTNSSPGATPYPRLNLAQVGGTAITADDIFVRLRAMVGIYKNMEQVDRSTDEFRACRWLAQLAVNIKDYLDTDTTPTRYRWRNATLHTPPENVDEKDWVIGVEQPELILNEVYATLDDDKNDPGLSDTAMPNPTYLLLNVAVELYNPSTRTALLGTGKKMAKGKGKAKGMAQMTAVPIYRLQVAKSGKGIVRKNTTNAVNGYPEIDPRGEPSEPYPGALLDEWDASLPTVAPGDQQYQNTGFQVVGPTNDFYFDDRKPGGMTGGYFWSQIDNPDNSELSIKIDLPDDPVNIGRKMDPTKVEAWVVLQRLADPTLPQEDDPKKLSYNPFITVDYFEMDVSPGGSRDSRKFKGGIDAKDSTRSPAALTAFSSLGRKQPLEALSATDQTPNPIMPPPADPTVEPKHTFKTQNKPNTADPATKTAWSWWVHQDRPLVNKGELLNVSILPQGLVTHHFPSVKGTLLAAMQQEPDATATPARTSNLMGRILDAFVVPSYQYDANIQAAGLRSTIRVPGRVNINTIWDKEVLRALLDPQQDNITASTWYTKFKDSDVDAFYNSLDTHRTTTGGIRGFADFKYTDTTSTGMAPLSTLVKLYSEVANPDTATPKDLTRLFESTEAKGRPYEREEMLRKLASNITFTSNAFAVWMTIGFFEVDMSGSSPALKTSGGKAVELGRDQNRHIRHRMFAIVDRSQMVVPDSNPLRVLTTLKSKALPGSVANTFFPVQSTSGKLALTVPVSWKLQNGMPLKIRDTISGKSEIVKVQSVNHSTGSFEANLTDPVIVAAATDATKYVNIRFHFQPGIGFADSTVKPFGSTSTVDYGYPGPQPFFNLRDYDYVVPYYSLID